MQPVIDDQYFKNGQRCRSFMSRQDAQRALDSNTNLTSDQYDSFWAGWNSESCDHVGDWVHDYDPTSRLGDAYYCAKCGQLMQVG